MEKILAFIGNISNIAGIGSIAGILLSILFWQLGLIGQKRRRKTSEDLITKVLDFSIIALSSEKQLNLRASVMLLDKSGKLRIKYKSTNMIGASDEKIILEKWQGAPGKALGYQAPVVADLNVAEANRNSAWSLTREQILLTKDIKAICSFPIRDPDKENVVGILNIDSIEPIAEYFNKNEVQEIVASVATMIAKILHSSDLV